MIHQDNNAIIYHFKTEQNTNNWYVLNDGVMGGLSESTIEINAEGKALFKGYVTTENNGGFASVRYAFNTKEVSKFTHVVLKIKGDGKDYQFRIKESQEQRHSYITRFATSGKWETIKIALSEFYPSFRGRILDMPNYSAKKMEEIAFLIGNKTKEAFQLEIESIVLE
ncbi:CIA30 family protein [Lacinutrix sp. C3R15]|nr:CIA30 family protein [Lacinutrix sp. C3R15]